MLRVGLTGGIGSGKSTVARRFAEHGAVIIDADIVARDVVAPGSEGLAELAAAFGADILAADGSLDRPRLAAIAFRDDERRARLNAIVHPRIAARTAALFAAADPGAIVVHDVPLLVENGLAAAYHLVLVVHADREERVRRLVSARGMDPADAMARMAAQADDEARRRVADVWLDNSGAPERVRAEADRMWTDRLVPYAENIRCGRHARSGPPRLVDSDPAWPAQARRLAERVRLAAGGRALRVDHIGSTSIPGLPARDIIDLQVTVASLADADAVSPVLADAGFPAVAGAEDAARPRSGHAGPGQWEGPRHASADPGRHAHLSVRAHGTAGWRYALLFRDWLRADPAVLAEYAALKRGLAADHAGDADGASYTAAKGPWFDTRLARADDWARTTGWRP